MITKTEDKSGDYYLTGNPETLANELLILENLRVIDYKIRGDSTFELGFTKDFVVFSKLYKEKIVHESALTAKRMLKNNPKLLSDQSIIDSVFYVTALYDYIETTQQENKIDIHNEDLMGGLCARVQEINETFRRVKENNNE